MTQSRAEIPVPELVALRDSNRLDELPTPALVAAVRELATVLLIAYAEAEADGAVDVVLPWTEPELPL